jgi:L-rhamnose mutarotase
MPRFYFALDLHDDPALIAEYEYWHQPENIWPDIVKALRSAEIGELEILRCGARLVMVIEAPADFSLARVAQGDPDRVQAWEAMMSGYQRTLPEAGEGEKWVPLKRIFSLSDVP